MPINNSSNYGEPVQINTDIDFKNQFPVGTYFTMIEGKAQHNSLIKDYSKNTVTFLNGSGGLSNVAISFFLENYNIFRKEGIFTIIKNKR